MTQPVPPLPQGATPPEGDKDSRGWAVGAHLSAWIAWFVGPLIVWLAKKGDPFVEYHSREALNFQLSLMIYAFGWIVLGTIGVVTLFAVGAGVVGVVIFGLGFLGFIYLAFVPPIIGAIRASNGEVYRYPISIRFVKAPAE